MKPRWSLTLVMLAACVKVAPFQFRDAAGSDSGSGGVDAPAGTCDPGASTMSIVADGDGERVCAPHYAMRFPGTGAGLPSSWSLGATPTEVLQDGDACTDERFAGIGLYPAGNLAGGAGPSGRITAVSHATRTELAAPFVVKTTVDWDATVDCGVTFSGHSSWSFFLDGHITRFDRFARNEATGVGASSCRATCETSAGVWKVSSYLSFPFTGNVSGTTAPTTNGDSNQISADRACSDNTTGGIHLGVAWTGESGRRLGRVASGVLAWFGDAIQTGTLSGVDAAIRTVYTISPSGPCSDLALETHNTNHDLTVNGSTIGIGSDGIYGGDNGSGSTVYPAANDTVTLAVSGSPIPAGSVLWIGWIDGARAPSGFTFAGGVTPMVAPVAGSGDAQWLFYFPTALPVGYSGSIVSTPP